MEEKKFVKRKPDFASRDGVAIWKGLTKEGKTFLKVKILNLTTINCFEPREETTTKPKEIEF